MEENGRKKLEKAAGAFSELMIWVEDLEIMRSRESRSCKRTIDIDHASIMVCKDDNFLRGRCLK